MKAIVHSETTGYKGLEYKNFTEPEPAKNEVKVRVKSAGLNHRDIFVLDRHTPDQPPFILGSDGAGVVEKVGSDVKEVNEGEEVLVIPSLGWKEKSPAPPKGFGILGYPGHGTFADYVTVPAENIARKPKHLSWEEAGVFPLAALTAYRALVTRANIKAGQTVFIPGAGSGVVTMLIQFAKAKGARVIVSSRSEAKRNKALEIGADQAVANEDNWEEQLKEETIDVVIESVGAATWERSLNLLKRGGTIVVFGASAGDEITLNLRDFFYGQYNLLGSTMGSIEEFNEMIQFVEEKGIKPIVDTTYDLQHVTDALQRLEDAEQFGKIALTI